MASSALQSRSPQPHVAESAGPLGAHRSAGVLELCCAACGWSLFREWQYTTWLLVRSSWVCRVLDVFVQNDMTTTARLFFSQISGFTLGFRDASRPCKLKLNVFDSTTSCSGSAGKYLAAPCDDLRTQWRMPCRVRVWCFCPCPRQLLYFTSWNPMCLPAAMTGKTLFSESRGMQNDSNENWSDASHYGSMNPSWTLYLFSPSSLLLLLTSGWYVDAQGQILLLSSL